MGKAWQGDWRKRIFERLRDRGFDTVTEFVETRPLESLCDLADELGAGDIAAMQLQGLLYEEALETGTMARLVRSLLVRDLREEIPDGWEMSGNYDFNYRRASAYADWHSLLLEDDKPMAELAWERLRAMEIPRGWLPEGPEDPILLRAFEGLPFGGPPRSQDPS